MMTWGDLAMHDTYEGRWSLMRGLIERFVKRKGLDKKWSPVEAAIFGEALDVFVMVEIFPTGLGVIEPRSSTRSSSAVKPLVTGIGLKDTRLSMVKWVAEDKREHIKAYWLIIDRWNERWEAIRDNSGVEKGVEILALLEAWRRLDERHRDGDKVIQKVPSKGDCVKAAMAELQEAAGPGKILSQPNTTRLFKSIHIDQFPKSGKGQ